MTAELGKMIRSLHHLLPAQRALEAFVHHNTLHAFEHLPFHEAVVHAGSLFGAEPYMLEQEFREAFARGRILESDLQAAVAQQIPDESVQLGSRAISLRRLVRDWMLALPEGDSGPSLRFRLQETDELALYPLDLPRHAFERLTLAGPPHVVQAKLWREIKSKRPECGVLQTPVHLSALLAAEDAEDFKSTVNAFMIRWCAAFLDGGQAYWAMSDRDEGFLKAMLVHLSQIGVQGSSWRRTLASRAQVLLGEQGSAYDVIEGVLERIGCPASRQREYLSRSLLDLPGWPGMFVQLAARPDLTPAPLPPTSLEDYLAVRLLVEEAVFQEFHGATGPIGWETRSVPVAEDLAWQLFGAVRVAGLLPEEIDTATVTEVERLMLRFDSTIRRGIWQLAFERRYRIRTLDGLLAHNEAQGSKPQPTATVQIVTCIDDREESLRRHIEEIDPTYQTFGGAAFYGVAAYIRRLNAPDSRPLCPANLVPKHALHELPASETSVRGWPARVHEYIWSGSTSLVRGAAFSLWGWASVFPMATDLLTPGLFSKVFLPGSRLATRLDLDHRGVMDGELQVGFTVEEMTDIVEKNLRSLGLTENAAPLVVVLGHGSHSRNNPHEAAYNCGACAGGRGGVNARAFAMMANREDVRAHLAARDLHLPAQTHFLGGYHDTCDDEITLYDLEEVPELHAGRLQELQAVLEEARRRDAHERCRRFASAPLDLSPEQALRHVQARSEDLAQARPEYNHAGNAICLVGRRAWSRGLFLDRRAFVTSYDPGQDPDGTILEQLLLSVGPVGAGINLEYYFSYVDKHKYGSNNKLPHNIVSLLGVMDGHQSDLRTGLYWQMVEIHEPMRLLNIIEARPEALEAILERQPGLRGLIANRWILVVAFDPETNEAWFYGPDGFVKHERETHTIPTVAQSVDWYANHRDDLNPASVIGSGAA